MKTGDIDPKKLERHQFHLTGTVDTLIGLFNALSFVLAERKKIEALFEDGHLLYQCGNCVVSMEATAGALQEIINNALEIEAKGEKHVVN